MIALMTDFGQSEYVGVMKAVIYNTNPQAQIVDLCHTIAPQCLTEAAWILKNNYIYFPRGTVFCCIIDPGVGSDRKVLAVKTDKYFFVAPDNGLLWPSVAEQDIIQIRKIPVPENASKTFHGRDVFASNASNIDSGNFEKIGELLEDMQKLQLPLNHREGIIVRIDHFGNIVTNIPKLEKHLYDVSIDDKVLELPFYKTYTDAQENQLFIIEGSNNTLEISLKNGNVNEKLKLEPGQRIKIS
jgi:S-adenosylmethionine hydrolase